MVGSQQDLFASAVADSQPEQHIVREGLDLLLLPQWLKAEESGVLFEVFQKSLLWEQSEITVYGKRHRIPRLNAWYGDPGTDYSYSGTRLPLNCWTPELLLIRQRLATELNLTMNSLLANLYRHGQDGVGWHADDEPELGELPVIACLSLGQARSFNLRPRIRGITEPLSLTLTDGSLLIMRGRTQHDWLHAVPKTSRQVLPRISLTFRHVFSADGSRSHR